MEAAVAVGLVGAIAIAQLTAEPPDAPLLVFLSDFLSGLWNSPFLSAESSGDTVQLAVPGKQEPAWCAAKAAGSSGPCCIVLAMESGFSPRAIPRPGEATIEERTVEVWLGSLDLGEDPPGTQVSTLSPDESARATSMATEPRRRFMTSRILLRRLIAAYLGDEPQGVKFAYGTSGKPFLVRTPAGLPLHFNLSHSRDRVLIAIARTPVGIDLETPRRLGDFESMTRRFFSPGELQVLARIPASERLKAFFACWTRKEAYLKLTGRGIAKGLNTVEVAFSPGLEPAVLACDGRPDEQYSMHHLEPEPGLVGALAVQGSTETLNCWSVR